MTKLKQVNSVFDTPKGIELYRLAAMKARLTLEEKGLSMGRVSTRTQYAKELGLKPRDPWPKFLETIQARVNEAKLAIYRDQMEVIELCAGETLVMSCDRSALISTKLVDDDHFESTVRFYKDSNRAIFAKDILITDETKAFDAAKDWVLETR